LLDLDYISNTEQVNPGDVVVTSGLDGVFPKGLLVGKVVDSRKGKSVFRVIQVEPFVDLLRIENVLILKNPPRGQE
jgi:rod shape-determining protein MreC